MTEIFEPLKVVKRQIQDLNRCCYRVYKSGEEFVTVEAATALEAIQESGVASPLKVERVLQFQDRLLDQQCLRPEKDEISFPTGDVEVAEIAPTQVRVDKEMDKAAGFSEMPFRTGEAASVINSAEAPLEAAGEEGFMPFAAEAEEPLEQPAFAAGGEAGQAAEFNGEFNAESDAGFVAVSGEVMEPETQAAKPRPEAHAEVPEAETLSEDDVAALLNEKPE